MRNPNPQNFIDRLCDSVFNGYLRGVSKMFKTSNAGILIPGIKSLRIEIVYPIRNSRSAHKRFQTNAAGYNQNRSVLAKLLKFSS